MLQNYGRRMGEDGYRLTLGARRAEMPSAKMPSAEVPEAEKKEEGRKKNSAEFKR